MNNYTIHPSTRLYGTIRVPGDKSISHRALMLAAIADGITDIEGFLASADCLATRDALYELGVQIDSINPQHLQVHGVGLYGLHAPKKVLDLGNSGTSIRLMAGLLAGQRFASQLTGDHSLLRRPMARIIKPLQAMGAKIQMTNHDFPPLWIEGKQALHAIHYTMPVASAQVKSGLLLAGLYAEGETVITEPVATRDHTERMLAAFGCSIKRQSNSIYLTGKQHLTATHIHVPADISSAAFFMVGATLAPGSDITLTDVGINPTRYGVIQILQKMGADITLLNQRIQSGEPVADIRVQHAKLHGITIPEAWIAAAIDEFPAIFIAAAAAQGTTILRGASELRVKESDRIQAMAEGLQTLGITIEAQPDGAIIQGGAMHGGVINSYGDHRIAMAFTMAGLRATDTIEIEDCSNVVTSFPEFITLARQAGLQITIT